MVARFREKILRRWGVEPKGTAASRVSVDAESLHQIFQNGGGAGYQLISAIQLPHARNLIPKESKCTTQMTPPTNKTIITVVGKDTIGIIAKVCTYLADNQVNIEDISQTIVQSYFTMMMIADTSRSSKPFGEMVRELEELGDEIGVRILCQHEEIFTKMHRI